jgi:transposase InsO family protein
MKGRYNGASMSIYGSIVPGARRLARLGIKLSRRAKLRLKWFDHYRSHGGNASLTCRYYGISRQTFYKWKRRYDPKDLSTLEDRSCRPRRCRRREYTVELVEAVLELREEYPRWGKDKLVVLLRRKGHETSASTVGRILTRLKARGALREPVWSAVSRRKGRGKRRKYAMRKPKGYKVGGAGDLVQVDTVDVRPVPGAVFKQFTARDVISKWDVCGVASRATARATASFLDELEERMPFPIKAIQVDGGSEFKAQFEEECEKRQIRLFVLPPRSPKLNGCVERANRTHKEEFYEVYYMTYTVAGIRAAQRKWEMIYNTVRPHQALEYLTPLEYLQQQGISTERGSCH